MLKKLTFVIVLSVAAISVAQSAAIDPARSTVTVRVYKKGLFSGLAHDHVIKAPIASGTIDTQG
jgi:hypothetical protein